MPSRKLAYTQGAMDLAVYLERVRYAEIQGLDRSSVPKPENPYPDDEQVAESGEKDPNDLGNGWIKW